LPIQLLEPAGGCIKNTSIHTENEEGVRITSDMRGGTLLGGEAQ